MSRNLAFVVSLAMLVASGCSDATGQLFIDAGPGDAGSPDAQLDAGNRCGNGLRDDPETCDDANRLPGDGCSAACEIEAGWYCEGTPSLCAVRCGDGVVAGMETCDDGSSIAGDGCSLLCLVEPTYSCTGAPSHCEVTCGNGRSDEGEGCDDGAMIAGDGCSDICQVEPHFECAGHPSICSAVFTCGDGVVVPPEVCDDGGSVAFDGCTDCVDDVGSACVGGVERPSYCYSICGDGVVSGHEQCDDGNLEDGDTCTSFCLQPTDCMRCLQGELLPSAPHSEFELYQMLHPLSNCSVPFDTTDPRALLWSTTGPAAGASWEQLCEDVVRCLIETDCMRDPDSGELTLTQLGRICYCGPETVSPGMGFCTVEATGVCSREIEAALGLTSSLEVAGALIATSRPGGAAIRSIRDSLLHDDGALESSCAEYCTY